MKENEQESTQNEMKENEQESNPTESTQKK